MDRVLRAYVPYDMVIEKGLNEIITQTIAQWEKELKRSLKAYYGNITHEFLVVTYELKIELVIPMYSMKR